MRYLIAFLLLAFSPILLPIASVGFVLSSMYEDVVELAEYLGNAKKPQPT